MGFVLNASDKDMVGFLQRAAGDRRRFDPAAEAIHRLIPTVNVYGTEPWNVGDLLAAEAAKMQKPAPPVLGDHAVFFSSRTRCGSGLRRTAGGGSWQSSQKVEIKNASGEMVGEKVVLKFPFFRPDEEEEDALRPMAYVMYEYALRSASSDAQELVICKMKMSPRG